jgi:hypothetical protein
MNGGGRLLWSRLRRRQRAYFTFLRLVPLGPYVVGFASTGGFYEEYLSRSLAPQ